MKKKILVVEDEKDIADLIIQRFNTKMRSKLRACL